VAAFTGWVDKRNIYGKSVVFGDGSALDAAIVEDLVKFMDANMCAYQWTPGQFAIIDNTVAYHSRQPFKGKRKVMACIGLGEKPVNTTQTKLVLSSGDQMPSVGFGLWKVAKDKCAETTYNAIKNGYRLLDEACDYGNEKECGEGIKKAIGEGIVKREDLFVTSKLWNTFHRKEHVKMACKKTLEDLGLEYLDLYLIHFPIALKYVPFETRYPPEWFHDPNAEKPQMEEDNVPMQETWEAMQELVQEGLVKNIGVSNFGT